MTTPIVPSITDEQLAELEDYARDLQAPVHGIAEVVITQLNGLIARLRATEKDAARYRWLRDRAVNCDGVYPMVSLADEAGDQVSNWLFGAGMDRAIDTAMEQQP